MSKWLGGSIWLALTVSAVSCRAQQRRPFTLEAALSAPYAWSLVASSVGHRFAWVENAAGARNVWVGGPGEPARAVTSFREDDGQDIEGLCWSPDGRALLFTRAGERGAAGKPANPAELQRPIEAKILLQRLSPANPAEPVAVAEGHGAVFAAAPRADGALASGKQRIFFLREGKVWQAELGGSRARTASARQLVYDRGTASQLIVSADGRFIAYRSRRERHAFLALYDLGAGTLRFIAPSTGVDSAPVFSPDSTRIAWIREPWTQAAEFAENRVTPNPWSVMVAELASGAAHAVYAPQPNAPGSVIPHMSLGEPRPFWTADGRLIFPSEADGWLHLYAARADSSAYTPPTLLTPGNFEVEEPAISADGTALLWSSNAVTGEANDIDRRHVWRLDLRRADARPEALTSGTGIETHPVPSADDSALAVLASDARLPMHAALLVPLAQLAPMHAGWLPAGYPAAAMVVPQPVRLRSADGLELHAQVFEPLTPLPLGGKRPALLFTHGGPNRQMLLGYPGMDYYSNAYAMNQFLAAQGYVVLSLNYRCGIGYGLAFRQCIGAGPNGAAEYADVLAAAAYLRGRADVDPKRIGLWGGSYGGYLTALGLARNSDLFAAGVDFHGVHDWNLEDNAGDWLQGSFPSRKANFAEQDAIAAKARASSPIADIARWRSPVLLIQGDDDPDVAFDQTLMLSDALRAHGVPVEELIFPDEVHGFILHRDWLSAYAAEATFFAKYLQASAPPRVASAPR